MRRCLTLAFLLFPLAAACDASGPALPPAGPNAVEIAVDSAPSGASITVDGSIVGTAPQVVKLNPGPHRLRASMSGYYPTQDTKIQVGEGEPTKHTLSLVASH